MTLDPLAPVLHDLTQLAGRGEPLALLGAMCVAVVVLACSALRVAGTRARRPRRSRRRRPRSRRR